MGGWFRGGRITLLLRGQDGRRRAERISSRWSLFVDREKLGEHDEHVIRHHALRSEVVGHYLRTDWRDKWARDGDPEKMVRRGGGKKGVRRKLAERGIVSFEGDVDPLRRYLSDTGHEVGCSTEHLCYFDLEMDSRVPISKKTEMRVLSWAVVEHGSWKVRSSVLKEDTDEDEKRLLLEFLDAIKRFDTCASWNGSRFDEPVLQARCEKRGIEVEWAFWNWLDHLKAYEKYAIAATGEQKTSLRLNDVAQSIVGEGKADDFGSRSWEVWKSDPAALLKYNEQDAVLMRKIESKTHYLRLHMAVCQVCRCLPNTRSLHANEMVDGYLLRLGTVKGYHFPSKPDHDSPRVPFEGAYVMDPRPGVYEGIAALDFASLYPSVIQTFNISPDTYLKTPEERDAARETGEIITAPITRVCFRSNAPGLFVVALDDLVARRKEMQAEQAKHPAGSPEWEDLDGQSKAFKVVINSFYGVMGSPYSRYYVRECGRAVSQGAKWLTEQLIEFAKEKGIEVIYADTDSAYLKCSSEIAERLVREFNEERVPSLLPSFGCKRNTIKLAYEKDLRRIVIVAAKRYAAAVATYKGTTAKAGAIEIKGLEYRRGDQIRLARQMQKETIDLLLRDGPLPSPEEVISKIVSGWRVRLAEAPLELEDFVLTQSLQRDEYKAKTPPPHARVAAVLKERGEDVGIGVRIAYWFSSEDEKTVPKPSADWDEKIVDRSYYWEKRVWPPTRRLLEAALPAYDWSAHDRLDGSRKGTRRRRGGGGETGGSVQLPGDQGTLFGGATQEESALHVCVKGTEEKDWQAVWEAIKEVLELESGSRQVFLYIESPGATTVLDLGRIAGPGARRALERIHGRDSVVEEVSAATPS